MKCFVKPSHGHPRNVVTISTIANVDLPCIWANLRRASHQHTNCRPLQSSHSRSPPPSFLQATVTATLIHKCLERLIFQSLYTGFSDKVHTVDTLPMKLSQALKEHRSLKEMSFEDTFRFNGYAKLVMEYCILLSTILYATAAMTGSYETTKNCHRSCLVVWIGCFKLFCTVP